MYGSYTVCYVGLVADHLLLVDHLSPRPAHRVRTVILSQLIPWLRRKAEHQCKSIHVNAYYFPTSWYKHCSEVG
jgi:hypothetical protein